MQQVLNQVCLARISRPKISRQLFERLACQAMLGQVLRRVAQGIIIHIDTSSDAQHDLQAQAQPVCIRAQFVNS